MDLTSLTVSKFLQMHKTQVLFLTGIGLINIFLPVLFPILANLGLAHSAMLKASAHILLSLVLWNECLLIEVLKKKQSAVQCPFCGSLHFFTIDKDENP